MDQKRFAKRWNLTILMIPICDSVRKNYITFFFLHFTLGAIVYIVVKSYSTKLILIKAFWHLNAILNRKQFGRFGATLDNSSAIKVSFLIS